MNEKDQLKDELTQLRKKVLELELNDLLYKGTEQAGKIGGWKFDPVTLEQTWTEGVFRILEIDLGQGAPEVPKGLEFIDPEFRPMAEKAVHRAMGSGEPYNQEWVVTTSKGNKKWVNAVCNPTVQDGKTIAISGSFQEITSKKIVEEALKKSEARITTVLDNSPFPIALVDTQDQNILFWSKSAIQLFGHDPKTTEEWYELAYPNPEYRQEVIERWKPFLEIAQNSAKAVNTGEYEICCKDGTVKVCELFAQFIPGNLVVTLNDVTERKHAEEQLKAMNQQLQASEQQLQAANQQLLEAKEKAEQDTERYLGLINNLDSGIVIHAADTSIIRSNQRAAELLGLSEDQLKGKVAIDPQWQFIYEDKSPVPLNYYPVMRILTTNKPIKNQVLGVIRKTDDIVWLMVNGVPILDNNKEISEIIISFIDITEKKLAEDELLREKNFTENALDVQVDTFFVFEINTGKALRWNKQFNAVSGYTDEEIKSLKAPDAYYSEEDLEKASETVTETLKVGSGTAEMSLICKDGRTIPTEYHISFINDENGEPKYIVSVGRDLTARKAAENQLLENEIILLEINKKHSAMIENIGDVIAIVGTDGNTKYQSPNVEKWFGWKPEELLGNNWDKIHPEDLEMIQKEFAKVLESEKALKVEYRFKCKDGSYKPIELTAKNLANDPIIDGILLNYHDITERKKAEIEILKAKEKVEEGEKELRLLAESMPQIVWITRADGWNIYFNQQWADYTGQTLEESSGNGWNKPFHPNDRQRAWEAWQNAVANNGTYSLECQIRKFDGSYRWWLVRGVPIVDQNGTITKWFGTCTDIHDIKLKEVELLKAKELAEESERLKSAFLANMSHEIRTPMNGILGFTDLLKEPKLTGAEKDNFIRIIERSGNRLLNTVNDLIDYSRIEAGQMKLSLSIVNINELIDQLHSFFNTEVEKKGLQLVLNTPSLTKHINLLSDKEKLYSILTNLIKNAIKYTQSGTIEFGYLENKNELQFFVKDTGVGISKEKLNIVFDRFTRGGNEEEVFTEGSGLGLSISKAYVEILGGKIWVESEVGVGSQFSFTIPVKSSGGKVSEEKEVGSEPASKPRIKGLKILIAEDDEAADELLSILLKDISDELTHTTSGIDAVEHCRNHPETDLVLMDINLPEMNGYESTRQIREFNKDVVIISQTAYAFPGDREKSIEAGCDDYITKPIDKNELLEKIGKCLSR